MLYFGRRYTAKLSGSALKAVQCVNCGCSYAYIQQASATGEGSSPYMLDNAGAQARASRAAQANLRKALLGYEASPCPQCGWLQPVMVALMRKRRYTWMIYTSIVLIVIAGFCMLAAPTSTGSIVFSAIVFSFVILTWILRSNFKPNTVAHERAGQRNPRFPESIRIEELLTKLEDGEQRKALADSMETFKTDAARKPLAWARNAAPVDEITQKHDELQRSMRKKLQLLALPFLGCALAFCGIYASTLYLDESAFAEVKRNEANAELASSAAVRYLAKYPAGRHSAEVKAIIDDAQYRLATDAAKALHSTEPLRTYLRRPDATHKKELETLIEKYAAQQLKSLEQNAAKPGADRKFAEAFLELVRGAQGSGAPIEVRVTGTYTAEPDSENVKQAEKASLGLLTAGADPGAVKASGLLQLHTELPGAAFEKSLIQPRDQRIFATFVRAVADASEMNAVSFKNAGPTGTPAVEIRYSVKPAGTVTVFRESITSLQFKPGKRIVMRDYTIRWNVVVHDASARETTTEFVTLSSNHGLRGLNPSEIYNAQLESHLPLMQKELETKLGASKSGQ